MPDTDPRDAQWFLRRMPHPDVLKSVLTDDPVDRLLATTRARAIVLGGDDLMPKASAEEQQVAAMLHTATEAAKRLASDPETPLGDEEKAALDLFTLLLSRPAMLVKGGRVREDPENWPEVFEQGDLINPVIAGVGRIEFADKFKVGTGFIVGDKRVLTNNHVVCGLFGLDLSAWRYTRQDFEETMKASAVRDGRRVRLRHDERGAHQPGAGQPSAGRHGRTRARRRSGQGPARDACDGGARDLQRAPGVRGRVSGRGQPVEAGAAADPAPRLRPG
jgi:hypothetical protein